MAPKDPFPIERCSSRLRTAVLTEFNQSCPTFQDILSISPKRWMTVPGMGVTLLHELEGILQSEHFVTEAAYSPTVNDADLLVRIERLRRDLRSLKHDVQVLISRGGLKHSGG